MVASSVALAMFGVGDVADRLAGVLDPIAGRTVRMVERRGAQDHARHRLERGAGGEVVKRDAGVHDVERHGEDRRPHQILEHRLERARLPAEVAGPELEAVLLAVGRAKERKAVDVIDVGVGQEDLSVQAVLAVQADAQRAHAGAGVEDQPLVTAHHLEAGGVATIAERVRSGAWHRAADPPEAQPELVFHRHQRLPWRSANRNFRAEDKGRRSHRGRFANFTFRLRDNYSSTYR